MRRDQANLPEPKNKGGRKNLEWQLQGSCRKVDPEIFFLPHNVRLEEKAAYIREAKAVCAVCPVVDACLDYALAMEEKFGVWGGKSEDERRNLLRRRARYARQVR